MREKNNYYKNKNLISPFLRVLLVLVLIVLLFFSIKSFSTYKLKKEENSLQIEKIEELNKELEIVDEKLKEFIKNIGEENEDLNYEIVAREELGLIKKDEIIIKPREWYS